MPTSKIKSKEVIKKINKSRFNVTTSRSRRKKVAKKIISPLTLKKPRFNPIISPRDEHQWEAWQTFNPGVIFLEDRVHFIYRAIGSDGLSRLGYAASNDGFKINERLSYSVYEHRVANRCFSAFSSSGGSWGGADKVVEVATMPLATLLRLFGAYSY